MNHGFIDMISFIDQLLVIASFMASLFLFLNPVVVEGVRNSSSWEVGEEMPTPRTDLTATMIENKIYAIGGANYQED